MATINDKQPKGTAAAVMVPLSSLTEWENNPKIHDKRSVDRLVKSMRRNIDGEDRVVWGGVILARAEDGFVIAGHRRLMAAKRLGLKQVPVRFMDLPMNEAKRLALADNKLATDDPWNESLLADALFELQADMGDDAFLSAGFSRAEADELLAAMSDELSLEGAAGEEGDGFSDKAQFGERAQTVVTITAGPDALDSEDFKAAVADLCALHDATFKIKAKASK